MIIIYEKDPKKSKVLHTWMSTIDVSACISSISEIDHYQDITGMLVNLHIATQNMLDMLRSRYKTITIAGYCNTVDEKLEKSCKDNNISIIRRPITLKKMVQAFSCQPAQDTVHVTPLFLLEHLVSSLCSLTPHLGRFLDNYSTLISEISTIHLFNPERVQILHTLATIHAAQLHPFVDSNDFQPRRLSQAFSHCTPVCFGSEQMIDEKTLDCIEALATTAPGEHLESELLITLFDFHMLKENGSSDGNAILVLKRHANAFSSEIIQNFITALGERATTITQKIYPLGLQIGMCLGENLYIKVGNQKHLLAPKGHVIDEKSMKLIQQQSDKLNNLTQLISIITPIN